MKCHEFKPQIEEYFDGELQETGAASLKLHLKSCSDCSGYAQMIEREQQVYSTYARDVDATPELWASIQSRVSELKAGKDRRGRIRDWLTVMLGAPRLSPALAVLLVVLTAATTIVIMNFRQAPPLQEAVNNPQDEPNKSEVTETPSDEGHTVETRNDERAVDAGESAPTVAASRTPPTLPRTAAGRTPTPEELIQDAEGKYLAAIELLSQVVDERRAEMDPDLVANLDEAIEKIDGVIAETRRAAREHPGDPVVVQYMLAAYSRKVDVLREVANR